MGRKALFKCFLEDLEFNLGPEANMFKRFLKGSDIVEFFLIFAPQINSSSTSWWIVGWQLIQAMSFGVRQNWVMLFLCLCCSCAASLSLPAKREQYELLCKLWGLEWDHIWECLAQSLNPVCALKMVVIHFLRTHITCLTLCKTLYQFCEMRQGTHMAFASMCLAPCQMLNSYYLVDFIQ